MVAIDSCFALFAWFCLCFRGWFWPILYFLCETSTWHLDSCPPEDTWYDVILWVLRVRGQGLNQSARIFFQKGRNSCLWLILGDPGADSGCEGKSKRAEKYGTKKKSKEWRVEPLGTMSYQTSSKRSPHVWLLIGQKNTKVFWHQSEARTAATVWNLVS